MFDDSYLDQKNLMNIYVTKKATPLTICNTYGYPQSHHSVLNNFRSDFEDFSNFSDNKFRSPNLQSPNLNFGYTSPIFLKNQKLLSNVSYTPLNSQTVKFSNNPTYDVNPSQLGWSRFSNPIALRRSAKSSLVTYQAYQKVFKLRYEEGRAHVRLADFADSKTTQPYTTEQRIKYEKMLGKSKLKFYNTSVNFTKLLPNFNTNSNLFSALNTYFFEFPFLDGVTNDPTRHV
jgi:hypothetical protein